MALLSYVVQVLVALIVLLVIYIITLVVLNTDRIVTGVDVTVRQEERIKVFDGYANVSTMLNKEFNAVNQFADNFIKIPRSLNKPGGAQFTYQFWIKIVNADDSKYINFPILLKGDKNKYKIGQYPLPDPDSATTSTSMNLIKTYPEDTYIRCPLIKFGANWRNLIVQFNTFNSPLTEINIQMNPDAGTGARRNILSLLPINWYLMTFTFNDNYSPVTSSENGIKFQFYLNDVLYQSNSASTDMSLRNNYIKQNDGNLYLVPTPVVTDGDFMQVGNLTYYNYVPTVDQIRKVYQAGPPTHMAEFTRERKIKPPMLSAYNKLDIYNY